MKQKNSHANSSEVEFNGDVYKDDRMFILYTARCVVEKEEDGRQFTIYHDLAPDDATWCVVTYTNTKKYEAVRIDEFNTKEEVEAYSRRVEPTCPLISLGGRPYFPTPTWEVWSNLKAKHSLKEHDWREMYIGSNPSNPKELIFVPD